MTGNGKSSFIPIEELLIEEAQDNTHANETISIEQLRHLVRLVDSSDVAELEVKHGESKTRLLLRKAKPVEHVALQPSSEPAAFEEEAVQPAKQAHHTITSPLVGTFQSWSKSKDKLFTTVGDTITVGQHVGAIRSLNIPSEVESTVAGRVVEILVQDGQPIEYGQPLLTVEQQ